MERGLGKEDGLIVGLEHVSQVVGGRSCSWAREQNSGLRRVGWIACCVLVGDL